MKQSFFTSLWLAISNQPEKIEPNQKHAEIVFWLHFSWTVFLILNCLALIFFYQIYFWIFVGVSIISLIIPRLYGECPLSIWQWRSEGIYYQNGQNARGLSFLQYAFKRFLQIDVSLTAIKIGHGIFYTFVLIIMLWYNNYALPGWPF